MRTLYACAFVAASTFAVACGGGDAKPDAAPIIIPDAAPDAPPPPIDAQQFDFTCMGNAAPTVAANPINATGNTNDIDIQAMALVPVAGATVKGFKNGVTAPLDTATTDAAGAWSLTLPTGTTPLDGFVEASKTGLRTVRLYPPSPLIADLAGAPVFLFANQTFDILVQFVASTTQSDANGTVGLVVLDCANTPIAGATISVKQNGTELTTATNTFDASQLQAGAFLVFDIPPGESVVNATYMGMALRSHNITVVAKTTSTTAVRPGF